MKKLMKAFVAVALAYSMTACSSESVDGSWPVPEEPICEMNYTPEKTTFALWAPTAEEVEAHLYTAGVEEEVIAMQPAEACMWKAEKEGDLAGKEYTFRVKVAGEWL